MHEPVGNVSFENGEFHITIIYDFRWYNIKSKYLVEHATFIFLLL